MKNKIGIICLIIFFILISSGCIILSIPILEKEITDLEQYINAILMLISGAISLFGLILVLLVFIIKKVKREL